MSRVAIKGNASGTGTFTVEAPNSNTDRTLVLPDEAGTVLTSASPISTAVNVNTSAPSSSLSIDSNGYVTKSVVPSFRVSLSSDANFTATDTETPIPWNLTSSTNGCFLTGFTNSGGDLSPAVSGLYFLSTVLRIDSLDADTYAIVSLSKNDDVSNNREEYIISGNTASNYENFTGTFLVELTPSDTVQVNIHVNSDSSYSVHENSTFSGFLVG